MDWLLEQGIVFEPEELTPNDELLKSEEYRQCMKLYSDHVDVGIRLPDLLDTNIESNREALPAAAEAFFLVHYYAVKRTAMLLRAVKRMDAFPVFTLPCGCSPFGGDGVTKNEVLQISLNALPMPDYSTPWEQIIEYRSDPNSKVKFSRLRHWMSKAARTDNDPNEIEEEVETLLDEYRQHLKTHRMKTRLETLGAVVVAEVGLFTGGWLAGVGTVPGIIGMIATPLYSIKKAQVALSTEEQKAPGKELAYIVEANETFPHHTSIDNKACEGCGGSPADNSDKSTNRPPARL